ASNVYTKFHKYHLPKPKVFRIFGSPSFEKSRR
ncbi:MAG: hypothetical protein ACI9EZ_001371, partial [Halobacteriales archaeon]